MHGIMEIGRPRARVVVSWTRGGERIERDGRQAAASTCVCLCTRARGPDGERAPYLHIERRPDKSAGPGMVAIIETKIVNRLACVDDF